MDDGNDAAMTEKDFKTRVKTFLKADDEIKDIATAMKPKRKALKEAREDISDYMQDNGIKECSVRGGDEKLVLTRRESKIRPKKPDIIRRMTEHLGGNADEAIRLYDAVFENLETQQVVSVSRKKATARTKRTKRAADAADEFE